MSLPELSNFQINEIFRGVKGYHGCIPVGELKLKDHNKKGFWVLNLDKITGPGTHWTGVFLGPKQNYYIDAFGMPPPEHVKKFLKLTHKPSFYSDIDLQYIDSQSCGWFVVYVMLQLLKRRDIAEILLKDFTLDSRENERRLTKYFKNNI